MRLDAKNEIHVKNQRVVFFEIVLRCKNNDMEPGDGKKCDVKNKRGVQLDKQK